MYYVSFAVVRRQAFQPVNDVAHRAVCSPPKNAKRRQTIMPVLYERPMIPCVFTQKPPSMRGCGCVRYHGCPRPYQGHFRGLHVDYFWMEGTGEEPQHATVSFIGWCVLEGHLQARHRTADIDGRRRNASDTHLLPSNRWLRLKKHPQTQTLRRRTDVDRWRNATSPDLTSNR